MHTARFGFGFLLWSVFALRAAGQDAQLSQFYASPLVHNPAFAGIARQPRAFAQYRSQWAGTGQPIKTSAASGDLHLKKAKSGLGLVISRTTALDGVFRGTEGRLLYAYHQKLSKRWAVSYGLHLGFEQRNLGYGQLTFGDQLDTTGRFRPSSDPSAQDRSFTVPEVGGGLIFYDKGSYLSLSARHVNTPRLSSDFGSARLPMWLAVTGGHVWRLGDANQTGTYYQPEFTVAFLYKRQDQFQQLDLGAYYTLQPLVFGIWYRGLPILNTVDGVFNHDAISLLVGLRQDNLSIGYSYDINLSGLVQAYAGSHEVSLGYVFDPPNPRRKKARALPCPSF